MRKILSVLVLIAAPAWGQWDPTKPSSASPTRQSSEIRANWAALARGIAGQNLVADNTFLLWPNGEGGSVNPALWTMATFVDGQTVTRSGVGLADTTHKIGDFAVKVTSAAANDAILIQQLAGSGPTAELIGLDVSCGGYVLVGTANVAKLCVYSKTGSGKTCSSFHTGNGQWQWLTATQTVATGPDVLQLRLEVLAPGPVSAYLSAPTCVLGSVPPSYPQPSGWESFEFTTLVQGGALVTGTNNIFAHWQSPYYGIIQGVSMVALTAGPTGADLIFDVNTWDGAAYTSMFTAGGRPRIADGATRSIAAPPDSTFARAILVPQHGTTQATGGEISVDVDQVGSGTAGRDIRLSIRGIRIARPLQQFLGATE